MAPESRIDLSAPPEEIYDAVIALDDEDLDAVMADPAAREQVIDSLIAHLVAQFRPERASEVDAVLHVKLWDRPGGGYDHREVIIRDRACVVSEEPREEPRLTLKVRPGDLRELVTGRASATKLAFRGRLRVLGDLTFATRLGDLFELSAPGTGGRSSR